MTAKATYVVEWLEEDNTNLIIAAKVYAQVVEGESGHYHVGDIMFNGNEWLFIRIDRNGEQIMDGLHWIPVDPEAEAEFRAEHARIVAGEHPVDAELAVYRVKRRQHRDDNQDLAALGGIVQAKRWWNDGYWSKCACGFDAPRFGAEHNVGCEFYCTGYVDPDTGHLRHDGDTCPAHEGDETETDPDFAPWTCQKCQHRNEGMTQLCHNCGFDSSYP